jgi:hypothetical protein
MYPVIHPTHLFAGADTALCPQKTNKGLPYPNRRENHD